VKAAACVKWVVVEVVEGNAALLSLILKLDATPRIARITWTLELAQIQNEGRSRRGDDRPPLQVCKLREEGCRSE